MNRSAPETAAIVALYLFLALGGLWHLLGWFQETMRLLAGPLLIGLGLLLWWVVRRSFPHALHPHLDLWAAGLVVAGFLVEWIGVKSGIVFGHYSYGTILQPQFAGVPVAIGFAWWTMLISSAAIVQRLLPRLHQGNPGLFALSTALLMVLFDALMEPAAIHLGYWTWAGSVPPLNYLSWLVLGALFAFSGVRAGVLTRRLPGFAVHLYAAQGIYFALVNLAGVLS